MKFEHKIANNKITISAYVEPRKHPAEEDVRIGVADVERYCDENNVPIGRLVNTKGPVVCSNDSPESNTKIWIYEISAQYKKNLTSKINSANIKQDKKQSQPRKKKRATSSTRARASRIVAQKKQRAKKDEQKTNPEQPEVETT